MPNRHASSTTMSSLLTTSNKDRRRYPNPSQSLRVHAHNISLTPPQVIHPNLPTGVWPTSYHHHGSNHVVVSSEILSCWSLLLKPPPAVTVLQL
ncbi:unnamed protein product [Linum trigynum]|uniref:Uncharacterized protein n=1 Tax=Linum trigynum TaxID=586398 RepID=A0AAV2DHI5_9ROSI